MRPRNPDLPILDELGAEFEALVGATADRSAAIGGPAHGLPGDDRGGAVGAPRRVSPGDDGHAARRRAPTMPSRAARERRSQARRVGRRAAIVLVLVCLVGGVAVAALRGGGGAGAPSHTEPTPIGRADDGAWAFSVYRDGGRLCGAFVPRGGEPSARCGIAPGRDGAWAGSAIAGGRRYVFGLVGTGVARVEASLAEPGTSRATRRTGVARARSPIDPSAAADAGLPAADRWFVLDLGRVSSPAGQQAPAIVKPLDREGHPAGTPYVDCSLGIVGEACRRRIEASAGD